MRTKLKVFAACGFFLTSVAVNAETVWCRKFNLGCPTPEEKSKKMANCQMLANQTYQSALKEAFADPSVWRLGGFSSAQDYAFFRKQNMLQVCLR